jgi:STE24 endopeptidase
VSFLLMVFLTMVCLFEDRYAAPPWHKSPEVSLLLTAGLVLLVGAHAFWVSRRVSRPLARDPSLRDRLLSRYEHWRFIHQMVQFGLFGLTLIVIRWGWWVRLTTGHDNHGQWIAGHGTEILTLLPFLAGQLLTSIFFYDADCAVHRAAHRVVAPDPFAQKWLESRGSAPIEPVQNTDSAVPSFGGRWTYVAFQLRQKLALVFVPVILLIAQKEFFRHFTPERQQWQQVINCVGFVILLGVFIAMPWLIRLVLGLKPLPPGVLRDRLMESAHRLRFRCSDILLWNTRSGMANAMVVGLIPWLRYVVFTDRLVEEFPEDELEAVFGHEVGHVRHHHMLYYLVFLVLSMLVLGMVGHHYLLPMLDSLGTSVVKQWPAAFSDVPIEMQPIESRDDLALLLIVPLVVGYIFTVFGLLSRRCERQADVFGCRAVSCGDPNCLGHAQETRLIPEGKALCATGINTFMRALEKVAHVNGISRNRPGFLQSWQHSTIARRVTFLRSVLIDSQIEALFQRRLALGKWVLLLGLGLALAALLCRFGWQ